MPTQKIDPKTGKPLPPNSGGMTGQQPPKNPATSAPKPPQLPDIPNPEMENASVADRVTGLLQKDSPLMRRAETVGRQASNRRGLMNSSMGVQAVETARLDAALPIASQEAQQAHQTNLQRTDLTSQQRMQQADITSREYQQQFDASVRERIAGLDREAQERIANINIAASERQAAASLAASFENSYSQILANIMNNPDLPADVRQQYVEHAGRVRDSNLALVEQMYGIELNWGAPATNPAEQTVDRTPSPNPRTTPNRNTPGEIEPDPRIPGRKNPDDMAARLLRANDAR